MLNSISKIAIVVGTRPNFVKVTQFPRLMREAGSKFHLRIIHTGQHFDDRMSKVFFEQFSIFPDEYLNVEGNSPGIQIANMMIGLEKSFRNYNPDLVVVVGDVNSTLAAAVTANKMNIRVAHVESGLRSFDRSMPEEINRVLTDDIADYFFVTEQSGMDNLLKEGKSPDRIFFVGNTMIDTMVAFLSEIDSSEILKKINVEKNRFVLMTIHRPATVDTAEGLGRLVELIKEVSARYKIVFPIHPRTLKNLKELGINVSNINNLVLTDPMDYFSFQKLIKHCKFIITDSGGIQEESTFVGVPCLTLRANTERPSTVLIGSNELIPFSITEIRKKILEIEESRFKKGDIPPLWDGNATKRIIEVLLKLLS